MLINLYFAESITDLFPLIATLQFTLMAKKQAALSLKWAQLVNTAIWFVYHIMHRNYIYTISSIVLLVLTIIRIRKGVEE